MALATIAEYVDYLADRVGFPGDAGVEARCLDFLQEVEYGVWTRRDWWFRRKSVDVAMVAGTADYTLSDKTPRLFEVRVGSDGVPLRYLPPRVFRELCSSNPGVSDTPELWTRLSDLTGGVPAWSVWPVPVDNGTFKVEIEAVAGVLTNSEDSYSALPPDWRHVVLQGALVKVLGHYDKIEGQQLADAMYQQTLLLLESEDDRVKRGDGA